MSEDQLQVLVADYLDLALPPSARWFHVPNGGLRHKAVSGRMRAMGVKPGAPDVLVLWGTNYIWIELKTQTGRLNPEQARWRDWLVENKAPWFLCRSIEDVEAALRSLHMPLREIAY